MEQQNLLLQRFKRHLRITSVILVQCRNSHQHAASDTGVIYLHITPHLGKLALSVTSHCDYIHSAHPEVSTIHFYNDGPYTQCQGQGCTIPSWNIGARQCVCLFDMCFYSRSVLMCVCPNLPLIPSHLSHLFLISLWLLFPFIPTDTTIKLFSVTEEAVSEMPNNVVPIPSTMRMYQELTVIHGKLIYSDVCCLCTTTQNLNCDCFNAKHFEFGGQQMAPVTLIDKEEVQ